MSESKYPQLSCMFGESQGSVLGPLRFILYLAPIGNVVSPFVVHFHQYADDTQLYTAIAHPNYDAVIDNRQCCMQYVNHWFLRNGLAINPDKTELTLLLSAPKLAHLGNPAAVNIAGCTISPVSSIKNLGVVLESRNYDHRRPSKKKLSIVLFPYQGFTSNTIFADILHCKHSRMFNSWCSVRADRLLQIPTI